MAQFILYSPEKRDIIFGVVDAPTLTAARRFGLREYPGRDIDARPVAYLGSAPAVKRGDSLRGSELCLLPIGTVITRDGEALIHDDGFWRDHSGSTVTMNADARHTVIHIPGS